MVYSPGRVVFFSLFFLILIFNPGLGIYFNLSQSSPFFRKNWKKVISNESNRACDHHMIWSHMIYTWCITCYYVVYKKVANRFFFFFHRSRWGSEFSSNLTAVILFRSQTFISEPLSLASASRVQTRIHRNTFYEMTFQQENTQFICLPEYITCLSSV